MLEKAAVRGAFGKRDTNVSCYGQPLPKSVMARAGCGFKACGRCRGLARGHLAPCTLLGKEQYFTMAEKVKIILDKNGYYGKKGMGKFIKRKLDKEI